MPWSKDDAERHTKKATSEKKRRQWAHVANSVLEEGGSEAHAVRAANAAVKRESYQKEFTGKRRK